MSELAGGLIAVGVDGSPASVAALRWAADLARLRDAEIVVVRAWHVALASLAPYAPVSRRPTQEGERRRAEADLAGAMRTALGPAPEVKVRAALVCGPPARVPLNQCADADLLVLGGHHADSPLRPTVGAIARGLPAARSLPRGDRDRSGSIARAGGGPGRDCLRRSGPGYRRRGLPGHCRSRGGRISRR